MTIVVLTPNPAIDVTYRIDKQVIGKTHRVREAFYRPGGKGLNVARVLETAGRPTLSILPLGGVAGAQLMKAAESLQLDLRAIPIHGETRTTVTIIDDIHDPTLFTEPGPTVTADEWATLTSELHAVIATASALVVSGSFPPEAPVFMMTDWVHAARARGLPTVVDVSGEALLHAARAGAICKPNRDEIIAATGLETERESADVLLNLGAEAVIVSNGAFGITAYERTAITHQVAVPELAGNPTGAGDAATAGYLLSLLSGQSMSARLATACAFGAASLLAPVAGEIDRNVAQQFLCDLLAKSEEQ